MSTTARKARKRAGESLVKLPKVGTPVVERIENQPTTIVQPGSYKQTRFGLTPRAARRLKDRGVERRFEGPAEGSK